MRGARAVIDLRAIGYNYNLIRELLDEKNPDAHILCILKANAYGHGAVEVAQFLAKYCSAEGFGVASIEEALELRLSGIQNRILLLEGFFTDEDELSLIDKYNFSITIHCEEQLKSFMNYPFKKPVEVHLKLDSGMNRLGFTPAEYADKYRLLKNHKNVSGIVKATHFAFADIPEKSEYTLKQWRIFEKAAGCLPDPLSAGGGVIVVGWLNTIHMDWLRTGSMLYGLDPYDLDAKAPELPKPLIPAMKLMSTIVCVKHVEKDQPIGYGGAYVTTRDSLIGVVAIGYGDGFPQVRNGCPVIINGKRVPTVGKVCMDMLAIDVTDVPDVKRGDDVVLWGNPELTIEEVSTFSNENPFEIITGLTRRVPLQYTF
ncbi:alanine racemase Alr2 [Schizosaccharomyces pombe]|uniref:Putative alanine racemase 2 n=1 Tax=Schizosaccharomyces pombe (strain 972 / ATCC 24843) TaxID=284812 RepID=ALR2_SCHPO|nr:putative alanine racemase Alr2 [Schizosaccharomyces pombe]Q9P5N3.1 RecName: Full=Putative alanine racemase 2 [Schizosaccharomyces pombe 972h-]CAB91571.1 alanine racemase Alr2 (predicted) [Schizosaccharomyces pombe]|eukprot:NP_595052.1 putative alanine racemase Alr2 [Schizosaccharomyces pombe]